jgi:NDP-sugar pyrophosphorylase family protein
MTDELHAVVLAGGKGTRLRPFTTALPKPLVPIGDECSILEIVLRQLAHRGFRRATIAIGHLGTLIQAVVGDGSLWGIEVDYAPEDRPLGTIGPVIGVLDRLPDHFLVLNGDVLTDLDYAMVLRSHAGSGAPLTIATYRRTVDIDFGVLEVADEQVIGFQEKPQLGYAVSMGVYGLSRDTLADYPRGAPFGFDDLVTDLLARGRHPASLLHDGYWLDIGRPEDYEQANRDFERMRAVLLPGSDA